jgi:predicted regulator of Ras-like GTPase activity (Roadblock/LC7/MglB family)
VIVRFHAQKLSNALHRDFPLVRRVLLARTDGLLFFDDQEQEDGHAAAAVAAAMLGLGQHVSQTHQHGELQSAIVRSLDGAMIVYAAGNDHVLAIYSAPDINLILLDRVTRTLINELQRADEGSVRMVDAG